MPEGWDTAADDTTVSELKSPAMASLGKGHKTAATKVTQGVAYMWMCVALFVPVLTSMDVILSWNSPSMWYWHGLSQTGTIWQAQLLIRE